MSSECTRKQEPLDRALLDENLDLLDKNHSLQDEIHALKDELQILKMRLAEAEELKRAISEGDLDALVIHRPEGELIFTLDSADRAYRALVETMNEGTVTLAFDGTVLYCNRQFAKLMRTSPQSIVGSSIHRFIEPENAAIFKAFLKHGKGNVEISLRTADGASVPVYLSISSLKEEESSNAWCLVFTDLTEQKKSEEIIASERLARSIIEQVAEVIVVCDTSGRITRFSNSLSKLCGCDPLFQQFENLIDLKFSEGANAGKSTLPISSALNGSTILGVEVSFEPTNCQRFNLLLNSGSLKNDNGEIIGYVLTLTDITERKQAEEALRESEERLRLLGDNLPDSAVYQYIHELDGSVRFLYFSAGIERLNSISVSDVLRDPDTLHRQIPSEYFERLVEAETKSASQLSDFDMEIPMQLPNGQIRWMRMHSHPRRLPDGRTVWDGVQIDITEQKRAEEALRKSEERYRMLFTNMSEGFGLAEVIYDKDGNPCDHRYIELNPAFEIITGIDRNQALGKSYLDVFPNVNPMAIEKYYEVAVSGQPAHFEAFSYKLNLYLDIYAFSPEKGKFASIFRDITKRKEAEIALKEAHDTLEEKVKDRTTELEKAYNSLKGSEKSLAEAQKIAHIGNWERNFATNKILWSDEMYRIFGLKPQEFEVTFDLFLSYVHPDDRDRINNAVKRALAGNPLDIDFRIILVNAEERIVCTKGEVIFDDENNPVQIRGVTQDITERKRDEEALNQVTEHEKFLADVVEKADMPFGVGLPDGKLLMFNQAFANLLGYSHGELIKKHWAFDLTPPEWHKYEAMQLNEAIRTRKPVRYEKEYFRKNGTRVPAELFVHPVFDTEGNLLNYRTFVTDITERKKAEEALAKIEIARKKEIHHRIKNNLQVISSLLDLQAEQFRGKECIQDSEVLEAFRESQNRVISMALIHEELYRGGGFETLNFSPYIKELAENLFQTYRLGDTDISLKLDLSENAFFDMDIAVPLGMVVNELVSNSLKHAFIGRDRGEIRIELCREESTIFECEDCESTSFILTIYDNGMGIPELEIEDLDSLGMQLVTSLVDQLDGELELRRNNGTEFVIRFTAKEK